MNTKTLAAAVAAFAVVFAAAACGDSETNTTAVSGTTPAGTSASEEAHNQADVMFAQMMIPHHSQAVQMSDMLLAKKGIPQPVTDLAEQIKAAQAPEIDQLTTWLEQWGEPTRTQGMHGMDHDMPGMEGMEGMMSEQDMRALSEAQGTDAARLFLTQMTAHHQGAITMARTEIDEGQFPPAVQMAHDIVDTQRQEMGTMQQLLTTL